MVSFVVPITYCEEDFEEEMAEGLTFEDIVAGYKPEDMAEFALDDVKDRIHSVRVIVDGLELKNFWEGGSDDVKVRSLSDNE